MVGYVYIVVVVVRPLTVNIDLIIPVPMNWEILFSMKLKLETDGWNE